MQKFRKDQFNQLEYQDYYEDTTKKARKLYDNPNYDIYYQKDYSNKLKNQREKIQSLRESYQKAKTKIQQQQGQIQKYKKVIQSLSEKTKQIGKFKDLLHEHEILKHQNQQNMKEITELKKKCQELVFEKKKNIKELKIYFGQELRQFQNQIIQMKQRNQELQIKLNKSQKAEFQIQRQYSNIKQKYEKIKNEMTSSHGKYKVEYNNFEKILEQRDLEINKLKNKISIVQKTNLEQTYYIQLEKQRNEQIQQEFTGVVSQLKNQIKYLQRQISNKNNEKDDKSIQKQKIKQKLKEDQLKIIELQQQISKLKINNQQSAIKFNFLVKEEKKKIAEEKQILQKEINDLKRQYFVMQMKYEKLYESNKKKDMKEIFRKNLIQYEHQEIDKLSHLLK